MSISKPWDWNAPVDAVWQIPSEESYGIAARWKRAGFHDLLDFGCGLGRHSIYFAQEGFDVQAFDLSPEAGKSLTAWAAREQLHIPFTLADMLALPYADNSFDCIFAYHVVSHTDCIGIRTIFSEICRVLRPQGEIYLTLCAKDTWSFCKAGYPQIDANTIRKTGDGPENGIPHFYVDFDDIMELLPPLEPVTMRHINDCWYGAERHESKHYFILARQPE